MRAERRGMSARRGKRRRSGERRWVEDVCDTPGCVWRSGGSSQGVGLCLRIIGEDADIATD